MDPLEVAGTPWKLQGPSGSDSTPWEQDGLLRIGRDPLEAAATPWMGQGTPWMGQGTPWKQQGPHGSRDPL